MILLAGVSKSGKTHTLREAMDRDPAMRSERASSILRKLGRPLRNLSPEDTQANQVALLDALDALPTRDACMLLDGHALIESAQGAVLLPDQIFDRMRLSGIVVITERPEIVAARRKGGDLEIGADRIGALQGMEIKHCERQARRLRIPCLVVRSGDADALLEAAWSALRSRREVSDGH